jgi:hypothetical protein
MWTKYLSNIEKGWNKTYHATKVGKIDKFLAGDQPLPNPFRSLLPPDLQITKWIPYDYIL